ncbi:hypothetical protein [Chryseobacterium sp. ISL-6]|uniref:hypothetical protein n=1 Tax=Chryseobacterium sp. ISL-6 TaxID=2819143 RepID=UPI001BE6544C|nr:hypothetical protein [Chryseobacterium sp. ISL-6]MBT2621909.1 hypothetical protein [Chryseobacterium sp. ISL-6]
MIIKECIDELEIEVYKFLEDSIVVCSSILHQNHGIRDCVKTGGESRLWLFILAYTEEYLSIEGMGFAKLRKIALDTLIWCLGSMICRYGGLMTPK